MKSRIAATALLTTMSLGAMSYSAAAERGFYFGASAGQSTFNYDVNLDVNVNDEFITLFNEDLDRNGTAFEGLIGYQFFRFLAVEATYVDLGELSYTADGLIFDFGSIPLTLGADVSSRGATASVLGILPVSPQWELYGRAGLYYAENKAKVTVSFDDFEEVVTDSERTQLAMLGIGAAFRASDTLTLRLEYRYFQEPDEDVDEDDNIDLFTLGIVYQPY